MPTLGPTPTPLAHCPIRWAVGNEPVVINECVIEPSTDCTHLGQGLKYKDLTNANLQGANFSGLTLHGSCCRLANLSQANLQHARNAATVNLEGARFFNTTLPDGTVRNDHC